MIATSFRVRLVRVCVCVCVCCVDHDQAGRPVRCSASTRLSHSPTCTSAFAFHKTRLRHAFTPWAQMAISSSHNADAMRPRALPPILARACTLLNITSTSLRGQPM